jgi:hypothetical protein
VIELCDTVAFDVMPEVVWSWLESMPDHYLAWHPDHLARVLGEWWCLRAGGDGSPGDLAWQATSAADGIDEGRAWPVDRLSGLAGVER